MKRGGKASGGARHQGVTIYGQLDCTKWTGTKHNSNTTRSVST